MVSSQFGAFHFGARQFDAFQFGAFHFDAVPVRPVSLWRDASLARFTLARFQFLCLTAQKCVLRQFGTYLVLRLCWSSMRVWRVARVAYKFVGMFPFCEEEFFMLARISFCVFFLCLSCIISLLILPTCHRGYTTLRAPNWPSQKRN